MWLCPGWQTVEGGLGMRVGLVAVQRVGIGRAPLERYAPCGACCAFRSFAACCQPLKHGAQDRSSTFALGPRHQHKPQPCTHTQASTTPPTPRPSPLWTWPQQTPRCCQPCIPHGPPITTAPAPAIFPASTFAYARSPVTAAGHSPLARDAGNVQARRLIGHCDPTPQ